MLSKNIFINLPPLIILYKFVKNISVDLYFYQENNYYFYVCSEVCYYFNIHDYRKFGAIRY